MASGDRRQPPGFLPPTEPDEVVAHPSHGARAADAADGHDPTGAPRERDLHRRSVVEASPDEVWRALTDPDELGAWWGDGSRLDPRPGGDARFEEDDEPTRLGRVVEAKPGRRLVFDWWPEDPEVDEPASRVTIELVPCPFGTILTVTECVLLPLDDLPVLVAPRPTFLPPPWGPTLGGRARAGARVLVRA